MARELSMTTPGNKAYKVEYVPSVIEEDMPNLPKTARNMIKKAIEERLVTDPVGFGKPLRYSLKSHRRLRASDYRVVFRLDPSINTVIITAIKYRKDIYEEF